MLDYQHQLEDYRMEAPCTVYPDGINERTKFMVIKNFLWL